MCCSPKRSRSKQRLAVGSTDAGGCLDCECGGADIRMSALVNTAYGSDTLEFDAGELRWASRERF